MAHLKKLARPMLAGMFILGGLDSLRNADPKVEAARKVTAPIEGKGPLPAETSQLVRFNGAAQLTAGALLAVGITPRLCALVLFGTLVPTTAAGHRFWEMDGDDRASQQIHFLKNLAMAGGLLEVIGSS